MSAPQTVRGAKLGLPEQGPGSLASFGARVGAFALDSLACFLIAGLAVQFFVDRSDVASRLPRSWVLVPFFLDYVVGMLTAGRTLGMNLGGLRIVRTDAQAPVGPLRAIARTALLALLLPAVISDRDGRGLHERLTDTAVIRARTGKQS